MGKEFFCCIATTVNRIREKTDPRAFLLQTLVLIYSFTAAAFRSNPPSVSDDPMALVRLAVPVIAALWGLLLRDAYTDPERRLPHTSAVDVSVAFGLAFSSQLILSVFRPELTLSRWAPTQGGFVGIALLAACRALFASKEFPQDTSLISSWRTASDLAKLERQYAFFKYASYGYYGILLPSVMILLQGAQVYLYWLPLVVLILAELNQNGFGFNSMNRTL